MSPRVDPETEFFLDPPRGFMRVYRGVHPDRDTSDPTHGRWFVTNYDEAVSYANWDYEGTGELGPGRRIVAVDMRPRAVLEAAREGSRKRVPDDLREFMREVRRLDQSSQGFELLVTQEVADKAVVYEENDELHEPPAEENGRMRRNSDERLRAMEREWRRTGSDADRLAHLNELVRTGQATKTDRLILQAIERRQRMVAAQRDREARRAEIEGRGEGWTNWTDDPEGQTRLLEALERLRQNRHRVWVVHGDRHDRRDGELRNRVAGTPWERESGYIGRSTGPSPIYLIVPNVRSLGGPGLFMDSILEVRSTTTGQVFWKHPSYDPDQWTWESSSGRHLVEPWSEYAIERMVWYADRLGVKAGDLAVLNLGAPSGRYDMRRGRPAPPPMRSILANALNVHGEDWTRQAIEDAARRKHGNPVVPGE